MFKRTMLVVLIALATLAAPAALRAAEPQTETTYSAIMINDEKVGYSKQVRTVADSKVTTVMHGEYAINRGGFPLNITQDVTWVETVDGKPLAIESSGPLGAMSGTVSDDGRLVVKQTVGQQKTSETIDLPPGVLFAEGMVLAARRHGLKAGTEYDVATFIPDMKTTVNIHVTVGEKETIDLLGRVVEATKTTSVTKFMFGEIREVSYVSDDYETLRSDSSAMGLKITTLQCDKAFALSKAKTTTDFLKASLVTGPKPVSPKARRVVYTLKPKEGKEVTVPETDTQKVKVADDGTITVTVERLEPVAGGALPYAGDDEAILASLKPVPFIQSDDERIVEAARKAVGDEKDAARAAGKIAAWVDKNISSKGLSVGYASASEVIRSRQGDCTEHGVLTAAMCRAVGIPARIAVGLVYAGEYLGMKNVFGGHQWTQVYIGGKWVDLDATRSPEFRDAGRIILLIGDGEMKDFFALLGNFGLFDIVAIDEEL